MDDIGVTTSGRSPQGERGLKSQDRFGMDGVQGRSPQGERGLKSSVSHDYARLKSSLPARGAWIEINACITMRSILRSRSPQGERGLKSEVVQPCLWELGSLPARGAWIEMHGLVVSVP